MIFDLSVRYKSSTIPNKLNLGVGAYRDEALQPYVFPSVRAAEEAVVAAKADKEYLPVLGLAEFNVREGEGGRESPSCCHPAAPHPLTPPSPPDQAAAARLLFHPDSPALRDGRVLTCQALSGTGSLTLAAHLLKRTLPGRRIFCSDITWDNHASIVSDSGLGVLEYYKYYNPSTRGLDFEGWLADLRTIPRGSIVLLHAVAHNPTGVDPTPEQWSAVADVLQSRDLFPWMDIAYLGFASGDLDVDAAAVRMLVARGREMVVCQSFAKNMGLYCERVGAVHVVAADPGSAAAAGSQLQVMVRTMYSNPPAPGGRRHSGLPVVRPGGRRVAQHARAGGGVAGGAQGGDAAAARGAGRAARRDRSKRDPRGLVPHHVPDWDV